MTKQAAADEIALKTSDQWDGEWNKWYQIYAKGTPRIGAWIKTNYTKITDNILEIASGSARESRYLAPFCHSISGCDYSPAATALVSAHQPPPNLKASTMDAFALQFPDKTFDLSFHKGFWVLISDDEDIKKLFREQLRVTKRTLLIFVQNGYNERQKQAFRSKAQSDPLFQTRFFHPADLRDMLVKELHGSATPGSVRLKKFGGSNALFKFPCPNRLANLRDRLASLLYQCLPWSLVECAVLEVELGK